MMQLRVGRFIISGTFLVAVIVAFNHLQAQTPKQVINTAMCYDRSAYTNPDTHHITQYKGKHCITDVYINDKESTVEMRCALIEDCSGPLCTAPLDAIYECAPSTNTQGQTVWHCKGWTGTTMDSRTESNFTDDEFNDKATRCTRVCGGCNSGWK